MQSLILCSVCSLTAVRVPSSVHPDQISSILLLPLRQPPAVKGFSLAGSGALRYPSHSRAVSPIVSSLGFSAAAEIFAQQEVDMNVLHPPHPPFSLLF